MYQRMIKLLKEKALIALRHMPGEIRNKMTLKYSMKKGRGRQGLGERALK